MFINWHSGFFKLDQDVRFRTCDDQKRTYHDPLTTYNEL